MTQNNTKIAYFARWLYRYFHRSGEPKARGYMRFSSAMKDEYHHRTLEFVAEQGQIPGQELAEKITDLYNRLHKRKPPSGGSVWFAGTPEELRAIREGLTARERTEALLERIRDG